MRFLSIFCLLFLSLPAEARVEGRFLSFVGMVAVTDRVMNQITDDDPQRLYALMNVEPKEEFLGKGKAIQLAEKKFSLVCTDRGGGQTVCSLVVKAGGGQGTVNPGQGLIRFVALGAEAEELFQKFHRDPESQNMEYESADGSLRIRSEPLAFLAEFRKQ